MTTNSGRPPSTVFPFSSVARGCTSGPLHSNRSFSSSVTIQCSEPIKTWTNQESFIDTDILLQNRKMSRESSKQFFVILPDIHWGMRHVTGDSPQSQTNRLVYAFECHWTVQILGQALLSAVDSCNRDFEQTQRCPLRNRLANGCT